MVVGYHITASYMTGVYIVSITLLPIILRILLKHIGWRGLIYKKFTIGNYIIEVGFPPE